MLSDVFTAAIQQTPMWVTLARNGEEVAEHARRPVDKWEVRDGRMTTKVVFGPFAHTIEFDEIVLVSERGGERMPLDDGVRLPAGMLYEHETVVTVGG